MTIISPCDANEMRKLVLQTPKIKGPIYIRIARGGEKIITKKHKINIGKAIFLKKNDKL